MKKGSSYGPAASTLNTVLTDGSAGPASDSASTLRIPLGSSALGIGWPHAAVAPSIAGSKAVYADPGSGLSLQVEEDAQSVEFSIVYTRRPSGDTAVSLPLDVGKLALVPSKDGGLVLHYGSAKGPQVGTISAPQMFDGSKDVDDLPAHTGNVSMQVKQVKGKTVLVLTPDPSFLEDPSTVYPVTIDPTIDTDAGQYGDEVSDYVYSTQSSDHASLGYMDIGSYGSSGVAGHGFFQFTDFADPEFIPSGAQVLYGDVLLYQAYSYDAAAYNTCGDRYTDPGVLTANGLNLYDLPSSQQAWSPPMSWSSQPSPGALIQTDWSTVGNTSRGGSCGAGWLDFPAATSTVQRWLANPSSNHGFELGPVCELNACAGNKNGRTGTLAQAVNGRRTIWGVGSTNPPEIEVVYALPPTVDDFSATLQGTSDGMSYVPGAPALQALVSDDNDDDPVPTINANFTVANSGGTVFPQGSDIGSVAAQNDMYAQVQVPTGRLADGAAYTAQVTPSYTLNGTTLYGTPVNDSFHVDATPPGLPTISSTDVRVNGWTAPDNTTTSQLSAATFTLTASDNHHVSGYNYSLDGQPTGQAANAQGSGNGYATFTLGNIASGWHTVTAQAIDEVGNLGGWSSFTFGVGVGNVGANRTWKNVLLTPGGSADKTNVTYSWKASGQPDSAYTTLPVSAVTNNGTAISAWPVTPTSGTWPKLVWNAATTLGSNFGGLIIVRATYTSSSGPSQSVTSLVQLDKSPFGGSYATTTIGPGTLAETTGDLDIGPSDVSVPGTPATPLTFGRDFATLRPGGSGAEMLWSNQQSLEGGSVGGNDYGGESATVSAVSSPAAFDGTYSMAVAASGSTQDNFALANTPGLTPGYTYQLTGHIFVPAATPLSVAGNAWGRGLRLEAEWVDSTDGSVHTVVSAPASVQNAWNTEQLVFSLPTDAVSVHVRLYNGSGTAGQTVYWDGMSLHQVMTGATNATSILGPGWQARLPSALGDADVTVTDNTLGAGYVSFTSPDGSQRVYQLASNSGQACGGSNSCSYVGVAEAAYDGSSLSRGSDGNGHPTLTLTEADSTSTVWSYIPSSGGSAENAWMVSAVTRPAGQGSVAYAFDGLGRLTDVTANPAGGTVTCTPNPADLTSRGLSPGCRSLSFVYAATGTSAPGSTASTWGPFAGQLMEVDSWSANQGATAVSKVPVASYAYDTAGHLRAVWDPRISPALSTTYTYTDNSVLARLATITPPGVSSTALSYDSSGRLSSTTVANPAPATGSQTQTIAYGVPLSGSGLPSMTAAAVATWGQGVNSAGIADPAAQPTAAVAVFSADHVPPVSIGASDWQYAALTYLNDDGRPTNTASYGAGNWQIATTWYDQFTGNVTATLSPRNRDAAIDPDDYWLDLYIEQQPSASTRANLLETRSTYAANGVDLTDVLGPTHLVARDDGSGRVEARNHTVNSYDEGRPSGLSGALHHLLTTTTTSASLITGGDVDQRTTTTSYTPVSGTSGWLLGKPTQVTQWLNTAHTQGLTSTTIYNAAGQVIETRTPASSSAGNAHDSTTTYYTADNTGPAACNNKPALTGWTCQTAPASLTTTAGPAGTLPTLVTTTTSQYDRYGNPVTVTNVSGTTTRTTSASYDPAGRTLSTTVTTSGDSSAPVSPQYVTRDPATGLTTCTSTAAACTGSTVQTSYDSLGRPVTVTDATGATSTTLYDTAGRVATVKDCAGGTGCPTYSSQTDYTYDNGGATSSPEHRGLLTGLNDHLATGPGTFTATYDEDGHIRGEIQPDADNFSASWLYDATGTAWLKEYETPCDTDCFWIAFAQYRDAHGQVINATDSNSAIQADYRYDLAGRLSTAVNTNTGPSTPSKVTRAYTFDADTNRTQLGAMLGTCGSAGWGVPSR